MTGTATPDFLLEWARSAGPDRVLTVVRERWEHGRLGAGAKVAVELTPAERHRVGRLLDASWAPSAAAVPVRALQRGLATHGTTLEDLLVATGGPLRDRRAELQDTSERAAVRRIEALAVLRPLVGVDRDRADTADDALSRWVLRKAPPQDRAAAVAAVVAALPEDGGVLLPVLAARVLADAHGLDRSRPLGRAVARLLVLRDALAVAHADEGTLPGWVDPVGSAESWRAAWALGGVACDTVSSQVLVLNLPLVGDAPAVRLCEAARAEPVWLTLRSLTGSLALATHDDVFVCENPSILESAADRLGARSAPLVCTFGRPGVAATRLLTAVAASATLRVRADGDTVGWGIVSTLLGVAPSAVPWRMTSGTTAYEEELVDLLLSDLERR